MHSKPLNSPIFKQLAAYNTYYILYVLNLNESSSKHTNKCSRYFWINFFVCWHFNHTTLWPFFTSKTAFIFCFENGSIVNFSGKCHEMWDVAPKLSFLMIQISQLSVVEYNDQNEFTKKKWLKKGGKYLITKTSKS